MIRKFGCGLLLAAACGLVSANESELSLEQALTLAGKRQVPVIVDFYAPWCYSCYYMEQHVLVGEEWAAARGDALLVGVDVDSAEGAEIRDRYGIRPLPSYLVLDPQGDELGRIGGERTPRQFYSELSAIRAKGAPLKALQDRAADGDADALSAALALFHARYDATAGLGWYERLPAKAREAAETDARAQNWLGRLRFMQRATIGDAQACIASGETVLAADIGCDRPYELSRYEQCLKELPADERRARLSAQIPAMRRLVDEKALVRPPQCADQRSAVVVTAELYDAVGQGDEAQALLARAAADARERLGGDLQSDRNLADNLRVFLDAAGNEAELDALYPELIEAYPQDYVYANRYARKLAQRGLNEQALPYFESASERAYGVNRLRNAYDWAGALQALGRAAEARKVLAAAIKANGPFFPEELARLKQQLVALRQ